MVDKYGVGQDPYCYPGSVVLRNLLNIRDEEQLQKAERELSEIAVSKLRLLPLPIDAVTCDYRALESIFERCIGDQLNMSDQ